MRVLFFLGLLACIFLSCKKGKVSTAPTITFTSFTPNNWLYTNYSTEGPMLNFHIKDKEGDIGYNFVNGSYTNIYVINKADTFSFQFPSMSISNDKNMDLDVSLNISNVILNSLRPNTAAFPPRTDTVQFRFYVKDFAGNVSDTTETANFYYIIP